jgi:hypothetical protein
MPVHPEALRVVDQVVTARDGAEEGVDLGRALFTGVIERVAHLATPCPKAAYCVKPGEIAKLCLFPADLSSRCSARINLRPGHASRQTEE